MATRIPTTKFELKTLLQECLAANERHERTVNTRKQDIARQADLHKNQLASLPKGLSPKCRTPWLRNWRQSVLKSSKTVKPKGLPPC